MGAISRGVLISALIIAADQILAERSKAPTRTRQARLLLRGGGDHVHSGPTNTGQEKDRSKSITQADVLLMQQARLEELAKLDEMYSSQTKQHFFEENLQQEIECSGGEKAAVNTSSVPAVSLAEEWKKRTAERRAESIEEIDAKLKSLDLDHFNSDVGETSVLRERLLRVKAIIQNGTDLSNVGVLRPSDFHPPQSKHFTQSRNKSKHTSPFVVFHESDDDGATLLFDDVLPPDDSETANCKRRLNASLQEDLYDAAERGDATRLLRSLSQGATLDAGPGYPYKVSALHWAALGGRMSTIVPLLRLGCDPVTAFDHKNASALHYACDGNHVEAARVLLEAGASTSTPDTNGRAPLHRAAVAGKEELITHLLSNGADADATDVLLDTPLHVAAYWGNEEAARVLVQHGAKVDQDNRFGHCPLVLASTTNRTSLVAFFKEHLRGHGAPEAYVEGFKALNKDSLLPFTPGVDPSNSSFIPPEQLERLRRQANGSLPSDARAAGEADEVDDESAESDQFSVMSSRFWQDRPPRSAGDEVSRSDRDFD